MDWLLSPDSKDVLGRCIYYQTRSCKDKDWLVYEISAVTWEWLLTYDETKLIDAFNKGHANCIISQFLKRQFHSRNSPFFKLYRKRQETEVDLIEAKDVLAEDIE